MSHPTSLQAGTRIDDYEIRETLWTTNSGFIYRATELDRDRDVLIQEYLPSVLATRHWSGIHAMPLEGLADEFEQGLTQFLREARILAQINDPYVCRVYEYTETNATAYMVLDYEPGQTLRERLAAGDTPLAEDEIRKLLVPLLKGLRVAHSADLLHRDIHPANIYLRDVGPPVLIGFGSPITAPRDDSEQHVESRVAPGYSPVEQYQSDGVLGPWSDLYALGATMYRCLSGVVPVDATRRVTDIAQDKEDPLVPAMELGGGDYSAALLSAIDWMLEPMAADRPESSSAVLGPLSEEHPAARPAPSPPAQVPRAPKATLPAERETRVRKAMPGQSGGYRDHSRRRAPAPLPPPLEPPAQQPPRTARDAYPAKKKLKSLNTGWGWPAVLILAGASLLTVFLLHGHAPSPDTPTGGSPAVPPTSSGAEASAVPELPDKVSFGRKGDNARAAHYRSLERTTAQVEKALAAAARHMKQGHLLSPADDNALADYRAVLALDPGQADAKLGIAAIQNQLVKAAESAFAGKDMEKANRLLDQAGEVREQSSQGRALRQKIEQYASEKAHQEELARKEQEKRDEARQKAERERREQVRKLLAQADSALQAGRLTQPPGDNALEYFHNVLRLEPDDPKALAGVQQIGNEYLDQASDALAKDELDKADGLLNAAAAVLPDNDTIPLLRKQLDTRRAVVKQEEMQRQREETRPEVAARNQVATTGEALAPAETQQLEQGVAAYYGGDYDTAFGLLNPLAEKGEPRAKMRVAMMYYHGRGVKQDVNLAESLIREALPGIRKAVAGGAAWAEADLASLYGDGIVLAENHAEAVRLYTLAAKQGYAGAQTNLGVMYANGQGVAQSRDDAIMWFRRAAAQGDRIAQKNLRTLGVQ
ncbi:MAG: protein kinase [Arenicellales bacterium]